MMSDQILDAFAIFAYFCHFRWGALLLNTCTMLLTRRTTGFLGTVSNGIWRIGGYPSRQHGCFNTFCHGLQKIGWFSGRWSHFPILDVEIRICLKGELEVRVPWGIWGSFEKLVFNSKSGTGCWWIQLFFMICFRFWEGMEFSFVSLLQMGMFLQPWYPNRFVSKWLASSETWWRFHPFFGRWNLKSFA